MKKFKLTIAKVKKAGLEALKNNTMQICAKASCESGDCANSMMVGKKEYTCVIGAALPKKLRQHKKCSTISIKGLFRVQEVLSVSDVEYVKLQKLQDLHDGMVNQVRYSQLSVKEAKKQMKKLLEDL